MSRCGAVVDEAAPLRVVEDRGTGLVQSRFLVTLVDAARAWCAEYLDDLLAARAESPARLG